MSSDSSNSDRSLPDLGVRSARGPSNGPRRRIEFHDNDNDIAAKSPPKRAKDKWFTNLQLCRNIPRLDTTFRPRRLIDELAPSLLQAGLSKNVVIRTPRVKQIPRMPRMPGLHFSSVMKPRCSPSATQYSSSRTPSPSFSPPPFKSAEKRRCKKNSNPESHSKDLDECNCPRNCAVCGLAMQMIYEKVIALEEDSKKKMVCPCLECGCCFYNKPCGVNAHISKCAGLQPSIPRSGMLPSRRPVLSLNLSNEEIADISELNDWMYTPDSVPGRVAIPTNEVPGVRKEWFNDLYIGTNWLNEDHIDNMMIMLGLQHRTLNEPWSHNWSYLDVRCWHGLTGNQFDAVIDFVGPFASGRAPRWIGRNWRELQTLYGVGNVNDSHWFLYAICIPERIITVYDSNYSRASWVRIVEVMETYALNLGRLLTITEGFEGLFRPPQFQVVRCASAPQQVNSYDCGVMVVEYFRALCNGEEIGEVDPTASQELRMKYCAMLFKYGSCPFYGRMLE